MVLTFIIKNSRERDEEQQRRASTAAALFASTVADASMYLKLIYWLGAFSARIRDSDGDEDTVELILIGWAPYAAVASCFCSAFSWTAITSDGRLVNWIWQAAWCIPWTFLWTLRIAFRILNRMVYSGTLNHFDLWDMTANVDKRIGRALEMSDTFFRDGFHYHSHWPLIIGAFVDDLAQVIVTILHEIAIGRDRGGFSNIACVNLTFAIHNLCQKFVEVWDERKLYSKTAPEKLYMHTGTGAKTLTGHKDVVTSLAVVGPDCIASASWDGTVKMWDLDLTKYKYKNTETVHLKDSEITITCLNENSIVTTSSGSNGYMKILKKELSITNYFHVVHDDARYTANSCTVASNDGAFFLTSKMEGWNHKMIKSGIINTTQPSELNNTNTRMGGSESSMPEKSNEITKWNATTLVPEHTYPKRADFLLILDHGQKFVSATKAEGEEGHPILWDVASGEQLHCYNISNQERRRRSSSGRHQESMDLLDPFGNVAEEEEKKSKVTSICKHTEHSFLVASFDRKDTHVNMFWVRQFDAVKAMTIKGHEVRCLASIGGNQFVALRGFSNVGLWDMSSGTCLHKFVGHCNEILDIVYLPEKKAIATASYDRTIKVWPIPNHHHHCAGEEDDMIGDDEDVDEEVLVAAREAGPNEWKKTLTSLSKRVMTDTFQLDFSSFHPLLAFTEAQELVSHIPVTCTGLDIRNARDEDGEGAIEGMIEWVKRAKRLKVLRCSWCRVADGEEGRGSSAGSRLADALVLNQAEAMEDLTIDNTDLINVGNVSHWASVLKKMTKVKWVRFDDVDLSEVEMDVIRNAGFDPVQGPY